MLYAFVRVQDPNVRVLFTMSYITGLTSSKSELPKFVQINWCGDGVPEARKGLFYSHSTAVAKFLRGAHVVISARNEVSADR